jgi:hypothetical protein
MTEAAVSFAGNLRPARAAAHRGWDRRAMFRVAVSGRREQEASFFTVVVWRDQAEHVAESLGSLSSRSPSWSGCPVAYRRQAARATAGILSCAAKQVTRLGQESRSAAPEPQLT